MSKIISIHSFRGGTGKSNTTANLSALLAGQGLRVGVIDTDIQSPGIHVLYGLHEDDIKYSLNDYLWGKCEIEKTAIDVTKNLNADVTGQVFVIPKGGQIYLIPSSIKVGEIARVLREGYDVNLLNQGFNTLIRKLELDYLLIDTHPGLNEETLLSIAVSNVLCIILRPDEQDFQGTAVTVDIARKLEVPKTRLVVNKALTRFDFERLKADVAKTYDAEVSGVLPLSEDVAFNASGHVFSALYPQHPWSVTLEAITDDLVKK